MDDKIAVAPPSGASDPMEKKKADVENIALQPVDDKLSVSEPDLDSQYGVQKIQAITSVWTYRALITTYVLIYVASFTHAMQQQMFFNLNPYVTSLFSRHGLTPIISIVANLVGGVSQLPIARILNIWGRLEGYVFSQVCCVIGLILMAVCQNVETYAAAQVFWSVGSGGIAYVHTILISDTTSLRNRMIIFAINATGQIGSAFAGPVVAQLFQTKTNLRWAFGAFAIIMPAVSSSICTILWVNMRKAKKMGIIGASLSSGRNTAQSAYFYAEQFDLVGMLLLVASFSLVLLPFSIVYYAPRSWETPYIIAMVVLGVVLAAAFVLWEMKFATTPLVPWTCFKDRTIIGACTVAFILILSTRCWDSYFTSYLQVVHQRSISQAGFILNIYVIAANSWGLVVGILIRQTNNFKWIAVACIPVTCLATGLMIHFRQPDTPIGYIVMCQVLKAISSGTINMCQQLAVMAVVSHNEISIMLALIYLASSVGHSVGVAVSGAIWTNELPGFLADHLPEEELPNLLTIFGSLPVQLSYPWGSPAREGIVQAYGLVQRHMLIAGTAFLPIALVCILLWKNVNVGKFKQTKGNVF